MKMGRPRPGCCCCVNCPEFNDLDEWLYRFCGLTEGSGFVGSASGNTLVQDLLGAGGGVYTQIVDIANVSGPSSARTWSYNIALPFGGFWDYFTGSFTRRYNLIRLWVEIVDSCGVRTINQSYLTANIATLEVPKPNSIIWQGFQASPPVLNNCGETLETDDVSLFDPFVFSDSGVFKTKYDDGSGLSC
jgi:hypothetical protein